MCINLIHCSDKKFHAKQKNKALNLKSPTIKMDNFTDFSSVNEAATGFVRMAVEEFNTHQNWTNLVERYWTIIDERLGGNFKLIDKVTEIKLNCNFQKQSAMMSKFILRIFKQVKKTCSRSE